MRTEYSIKKSLSYVFRGGIATSAMDALATGPTLIAYAMFFGAGNLTFGILGAIPYLGNLIHLFAAWLIEKGFSVRQISIWASFLSRPFYLLAALLAFNPDMYGALFWLVLFLSITHLVGGMAGGAYLPWMKILVPKRLMGRFFSYRFKYMMLAKIICFLCASFFLKYVHENYPEKEIYAYATLLVFAFIIGLYGAYTFINVKDCKIPTKGDISFLQKLRLTLCNKPFQHLLNALSMLNFSQAFITPFITVFMLRRFDIQMSIILVLTLVLQIVYMMTIKTWGKIADRQGPVSILLLSIPLFILSLIGLILLNQLNLSVGYILYFLLTILHVLLGIATAGLTLGINNTSLLFVPEKMSAIYLSVNSAVKSFAGAFGSIIAGISLTLCTTVENSLLSNSVKSGWTSFYMIAILLCILAGILLKQLQMKHSH